MYVSHSGEWGGGGEGGGWIIYHKQSQCKRIHEIDECVLGVYFVYVE